MILLALMGLSEEFLLSLLYEATKAESLTKLPKVTQMDKIYSIWPSWWFFNTASHLFQVFLFEFYFFPIKKVRCLNSRSIDWITYRVCNIKCSVWNYQILITDYGFLEEWYNFLIFMNFTIFVRE